MKKMGHRRDAKFLRGGGGNGVERSRKIIYISENRTGPSGCTRTRRKICQKFVLPKKSRRKPILLTVVEDQRVKYVLVTNNKFYSFIGEDVFL
jgi:hypothetical protein